MGVDRLTYPDNVGSPAANMMETKILLNNTMSDAKKGARCMCADIKDHFLATLMARPEYMRVKYRHFSPDIRETYNLKIIQTPDEYIYIKIRQGMYDLRQVVILAYDHLRKCLAPHGYSPVVGTVGVWKHENHPMRLCLRG